MRTAGVWVLVLLVSASSLQAECVREGHHKAREIIGGVVGAAATSFIARSVSARPHAYADYHKEDALWFSPRYNRRMMVSYAVGNAIGIFAVTPRGCHSWWRPLPGTIVPTIPFWSASEKPFGMLFSSMFLPPLQAAGGTLSNSMKR
jgi:hypothetical protein